MDAVGAYPVAVAGDGVSRRFGPDPSLRASMPVLVRMNAGAVSLSASSSVGWAGLVPASFAVFMSTAVVAWALAGPATAAATAPAPTTPAATTLPRVSSARLPTESRPLSCSASEEPAPSG